MAPEALVRLFSLRLGEGTQRELKALPEARLPPPAFMQHGKWLLTRAWSSVLLGPILTPKAHAAPMPTRALLHVARYDGRPAAAEARVAARAGEPEVGLAASLRVAVLLSLLLVLILLIGG